MTASGVQAPADLPDWAQWLPQLKEPENAQVLAFMRKLRSKSDRYLERARKLMPQHCEVAIGAGEFDEWIIGESIAVLLGALSRGYIPLAAATIAKNFSREATDIHNKKRPNDANWQRWNEGQFAQLDRIYGELVRAASPIGAL